MAGSENPLILHINSKKAATVKLLHQDQGDQELQA
jgi:hypothetical protein